MTQILHASEQIRRFLRTLSAMEDVAAALEKAGNLENLTAEKQAAADLARKEVITQEAVLADLKKKQEAAKKAANDVAARAVELQQSTLAKARAEAEGILAEAKKKATRIVGDAEREVATLEQRAKKVREALAVT